mmetsp:Transcript_98038/g.282791  ORF Transcript_98038/g.282791 Transcript_98038/m.282791 type:complete len:315 (+) Transcript_98038:389-1333(+)
MRSCRASMGKPYRPRGARLASDAVGESPAVQRRAPCPFEELAADGAHRPPLVERRVPPAAGLVGRVLIVVAKGVGPRLRLVRRTSVLAGLSEAEEGRADDEVAIANPLRNRLHPTPRLRTSLPLLRLGFSSVHRVVVLLQALLRCKAEPGRRALKGKLAEHALQHHVHCGVHLQVAEGVRDTLRHVNAAASPPQTLLEQEDELQEQQHLVRRQFVDIHHLLADRAKHLPANARGLELDALRRCLGRHLLHELPKPCLRKSDGRKALQDLPRRHERLRPIVRHLPLVLAHHLHAGGSLVAQARDRGGAGGDVGCR